MWSKIFNNPLVQANDEVRKLLLENFDFESVYFDVSRPKYSEEAKNALKQAVEEAYKDLDDTVKNWTFNTDNPTALNTYGFGELLSFLSQRGSDTGWFFTLNQDLFMEEKMDIDLPELLSVSHQLIEMKVE